MYVTCQMSYLCLINLLWSLGKNRRVQGLSVQYKLNIKKSSILKLETCPLLSDIISHIEIQRLCRIVT